MPEPVESSKTPAPVSPRLRIGFLLAPRFTLSAFANFMDVLRLAADDGDGSRQLRCRWSVLSADMAPVQSSCGVRIEPDERLGDPSRFDYIVVVGGLIDNGAGLSAEQNAFLHRAVAAKVSLAGLCTGMFTLALGLKAVFLVTSVLGITGLWIAILADTGATVLVTLNALRLLAFDPAREPLGQDGRSI